MWIAIFSGVFVLAGVVVGGIGQIEASRRALLREQQLDAATQLHVVGTTFVTAMERRARALGLEDLSNLTREQKSAWLDASRGSAAAACEDARGLMEKLARVVLVFGDESVTGRSAAEAVGQAHKVVAVLADEGRARADEFTDAWDTAVESLAEFNRSAHEVFTRAVWRS